jgi:hypothetical protein
MQSTDQRAHIAVLVAGALVSSLWLLIYISTVSPTVNFIDSGELITAAYEPGIAHPPGYPLYILMGYVVSHLLPGEVAWRVNMLSAMWGAAAVGAMFALLRELGDYILALLPMRSRSPATAPATPGRRRHGRQPASPPPVPSVRQRPHPWLPVATAAIGASLFAASASFWSRTAQAKMYTLHYFFMLVLVWLALGYRRALDRNDLRAARWRLVALAATLGLSFTNHLMTSLLVPGLLILLVAGEGWQARLRTLARHWRVVLACLLAPLLLYLYLPLRSSQGPLMNWGSPDNWGDFWRHVRGWQYTAYLFQQVDIQAVRIRDYALAQWHRLTWLILPAAVAGACLLARTRPVVFLATLVTALLTTGFGIAYTISEIEPYLVPLYAMLVIWVSTLPVYLILRYWAIAQSTTNISHTTAMRMSVGAVALLAVLALASAVTNYPAQNRSRDRLAEQFALNVFNSLPTNSILITDYWDFYAPTYYLQDVRGVRRDIAIVNMNLLRYPWYTGQLAKKYPWLTANSQDIVGRFRAEQLKWVNGQPFDADLLNRLYFELLASFVDRNRDRPAYVLFAPCLPQIPCESNLVAPGYYRQPVGLVSRLLAQAPTPADLPPEPRFELRGITYDRVPMDEFSRANTQYYVRACQTMARLYDAAGQTQQAQRMRDLAAQIMRALQDR